MLPRMIDNFTRRKQIHLPLPLNSSLPEIEDKASVKLATYENEIRTISEWIVLNLFMPLPYSQVAYIASENMRMSAALALGRNRSVLPYIDGCRPFPKGTVCNVHKKPLHDDDNGCLTPSVWTNLIADADALISFYGTGMEVNFSCTEHRFCWFMGFVPHETHNKQKKNVTTESGGKSPMRISHSAYSKSMYEYLFLYVFSKKHINVAINNCYIC